jgi:hypothetical protein
MASFVGNAGAIKINGAAVSELRSYSIEVTADTIENTTMGDSTRQYIKGLSAFSGTADVFWDPAHFTGTNNLDGELFASVGDSGTSITVYPEGDVGAGTDKILSGDIIITGYTINGTMDGMIEASISFQGTGALTYATNG